MKFQYSIVTAVTLALLQGCGGGGDGASPSINTSTNSAWTQGDYSKTSNEFANRCETPRTGLDPYAGYQPPRQSRFSVARKTLFTCFYQ